MTGGGNSYQAIPSYEISGTRRTGILAKGWFNVEVQADNVGIVTASKDSSAKGVIIQDIYLADVPDDTSANSFVEVIEDTLDNDFASGTTSIFKCPARSVANTKGLGQALRNLEIYNKHKLRVLVSIAILPTTNWVKVVVGFINEGQTWS